MTDYPDPIPAGEYTTEPKETPMTHTCDTPLGCTGVYGECEGCDAPLTCGEARSGVCDDCWQARDEMGGE